MTANYHIPLTSGTPLDSLQLNRRLGQIDGALSGLSNGLYNFANLDTFPPYPATGAYRPAVVLGTFYFLDDSGPRELDNIADYALIRDKKTSGTNGGTFTSGARQTRDLNEEVADTGNHVSVAANQITAAAGTYTVYAVAPAWEVDDHQAYLQDITNGVTLLEGTAEMAPYSATSDRPLSVSIITGQITLDAETILEVQHECTHTVATIGYGTATGWGDEIYTTIELRRQPS